MGRAQGKATGAGAERRRPPRAELYGGFSSDRSLNRELVDAARSTGDWIPGAEGTERPSVTRSGVRLLWCWRPATGEHAYLNCDTDIIITDAEASQLMGDPVTGPRRELSEAALQEMRAATLPASGWESGHYQELNHARFSETARPGAFNRRVGSLGELVALTARQRGNLDGDDRNELEILGASPEAFEPGRRYLKVICDGVGELADLRYLEPLAPVSVRTVAGEPVLGTETPPLNTLAARTFIGTLVLDRTGALTTAFPGPPRKAQPAQGVPGETRPAHKWLDISQFDATGPIWVQAPAPVLPALEHPVEDAFSGVIGHRRGANAS